MSVQKEYFGKLQDGREVSLYTIRTNRLTAKVSDLGALLVSLTTPDRDGVMKDIVLGYDDVPHYMDNPPCFGAVVGPNANRIAGASFVIDGEEYHLPVNERGNNLHSDKLFYKRFFNTELGENSVTFTLGLPDGDAGFPGNRIFTITYTLTEEELRDRGRAPDRVQREIGQEYGHQSDQPLLLQPGRRGQRGHCGSDPADELQLYDNRPRRSDPHGRTCACQGNAL